MSSINLASPDSGTIRGFFDTIAQRYDGLNSILSFHIDDYWRRRSRDLVLEPWHASVLDLGTGTGKFVELFWKSKKWQKAVGLDFSMGMLEKARRDLDPGIQLISGDFHHLPFGKASFDLIISAFALRSVKEMAVFLGGMRELLTPGGKVALLCLTRPTNFFMKILYYPYLKIYLPLIGGLVSGNPKAYRFLSESILSFQDPGKTADMMREAGFQAVEIHRFTFGASTLLIGRNGAARV